MTNCARCDAAPTVEDTVWCAACLEWWREEYGKHEDYLQRLSPLERELEVVQKALSIANVRIAELERERDALAAALKEAGCLLWRHHEIGFMQKFLETMGSCPICTKDGNVFVWIEELTSSVRGTESREPKE